MNIWDLKLANFLQNLVWSIERRGYISLKEKKKTEKFNILKQAHCLNLEDKY